MQRLVHNLAFFYPDLHHCTSSSKIENFVFPQFEFSFPPLFCWSFFSFCSSVFMTVYCFVFSVWLWFVLCSAALINFISIKLHKIQLSTFTPTLPPRPNIVVCCVYSTAQQKQIKMTEKRAFFTSETRQFCLGAK